MVRCSDTTALTTFDAYVVLPDSAYCVRNADIDKYASPVAASAGSNIYIDLFSLSLNTNQRWKFEMQNDGYYMIKHVRFG